MGPTEQTIFEQFDYWRKALAPLAPLPNAEVMVFVGCGTSYNLALALAARANAVGRPAIAVPGDEWTHRATSYWPRPAKAHVVALSRSGETTETVAAARASRAIGAKVTAITVEPGSSLAKNCDRLVVAETHKAEGIVMTVSASLMVLLTHLLLGDSIGAGVVTAAETALKTLDREIPALIAGRSHVVFLGGGALYGIALEGALKLTEMSQVATQTFHPLEYRHGPISMVESGTLAVLLYGADKVESEAKLARELQELGAIVLGIGGPGDVTLTVGVQPALAGLAVLPALQLLGERMAQSRGIDTSAPRHLTKVVKLT